MTIDHIIWLAVGIIAVIGAGVFFRADATSSRPIVSGRVSYIVDGDTLKIEGVEKRIRLFGVDAPEKAEKGFQRAKNRLFDIAHGRQISCEQMAIDKYGRIVGRCFRSDGKDISKMMIDSGTAKEFCRYSKGYYGNC